MDKIKKKRVAEYSVIVIVFALFAIFLIKNIHLSTTDDHDKNKENQNYHANLSINFDQIYAEQNYKRLKEELKSGEILPEKHCFADDETISFSENETVFDVLLCYCEEKNISLDYQKPSENIYKTAYIKGIGGLYEGDCTKKSGWVYTVNGDKPNVGMSDYVLEDGDNIVIYFTIY